MQQTISAVYRAQQFWGEAESDETTATKMEEEGGEGGGGYHASETDVKAKFRTEQGRWGGGGGGRGTKGLWDPFICPLAAPPQVEVNVK